jgi:hypothetical protein
MDSKKLRRLDNSRIEIPVGYKPGMRVKGIIYIDEVLEKGLEVQAIDQVANVAMLPGIIGTSMAMPDVHTGYGFAIGGVAAFDLKRGHCLARRSWLRYQLRSPADEKQSFEGRCHAEDERPRCRSIL